MNKIEKGTELYYFGKGKLTVINDNGIMLLLQSVDGHTITMAKTNEFLSLTPYDLLNGGLTPLCEYDNSPKVGDIGYFWNYNNYPVVRYSKIIHLEEIGHKYVDAAGDAHKYFSKELPMWFKEKINN
jgi:hypothetical protein